MNYDYRCFDVVDGWLTKQLQASNDLSVHTYLSVAGELVVNHFLASRLPPTVIISATM